VGWSPRAAATSHGPTAALPAIASGNAVHGAWGCVAQGRRDELRALVGQVVHERVGDRLPYPGRRPVVGVLALVEPLEHEQGHAHVLEAVEPTGQRDQPIVAPRVPVVGHTEPHGDGRFVGEHERVEVGLHPCLELGHVVRRRLPVTQAFEPLLVDVNDLFEVLAQQRVVEQSGRH
jgi:hypothetical protein